MTTETTSPVRRFQIIDLMILTAAMAFTLMMIKPYRSAYGDLPWVHSLFLYFQLAIIGIHLAAIIWLLSQRVQTGRFFIHPGHWILGGGAINSLGIIVYWLTAPVLTREHHIIGDESYSWFAFCYFTMTGFATLSVIVLISACFYHVARWRIAMILMSLSFIFTTCYYWALGMWMMIESIGNTAVTFYFDASNYSEFSYYAQIGHQVFMLLTATAVCVAIVPDRRSRTKRDWLHWTGLTFILIGAVLIPLIEYLLTRFAPSA